MSDLANPVDNFSEDLDELKKLVEKSIERRNRNIGTNATYPSKAGDKRDNILDDIERLKILLEKSDTEDIDIDKSISALENIQDKTELRKIESNIEVLEEEFRKFRARRSVKDNNEKSQVIGRIFDIIEKDLKEEYEGKFTEEVEELDDVYGGNSLSSALLLRRIIEKSIFYSFVEIGRVEEIREDGDEVGLKKMINTARGFNYGSGDKVLDNRTGENLLGLKQLGDVAAHNFLRTVSMTQIDAEIHHLEAALEELPITD